MFLCELVGAIVCAFVNKITQKRILMKFFSGISAKLKGRYD